MFTRDAHRKPQAEVHYPESRSQRREGTLSCGLTHAHPSCGRGWAPSNLVRLPLNLSRPFGPTPPQALVSQLLTRRPPLVHDTVLAPGVSAESRRVWGKL